MIIMKKKFSLALIILIITLLIFMFVILICTRTNNLSVVALDKHYSLLYENVPSMDISLYSNHQNSKYFKKSNIESVKLYNESDLFSVKVGDIATTNNSIVYNNKTYYENKLNITLDVVSEQIINIPNANLLIEYDTDEKLIVKLGNISFFKEKTINNINVHKVQGIVNDFGMYQSLAAIHLNISSGYDCIINNISLISPTVKVNYDYVILGEELNYDHETPVKNIFGSTFNNFIQNNNSFQKITLHKNIKKDVIIPLHYTEKELLDCIGIVITYTINGVEYIQTINPYKLFNTNNINYFLHDYRIS